MTALVYIGGTVAVFGAGWLGALAAEEAALAIALALTLAGTAFAIWLLGRRLSEIARQLEGEPTNRLGQAVDDVRSSVWTFAGVAITFAVVACVGRATGV